MVAVFCLFPLVTSAQDPNATQHTETNRCISRQKVQDRDGYQLLNACDENTVIAVCWVFHGLPRPPYPDGYDEDCRTNGSSLIASDTGLKPSEAFSEQLTETCKAMLQQVKGEHTSAEAKRQSIRSDCAQLESSPDYNFLLQAGQLATSEYSYRDSIFVSGCFEKNILAGKCWPDPAAVWRKLGSPQTVEAAKELVGK